MTPAPCPLTMFAKHPITRSHYIHADTAFPQSEESQADLSKMNMWTP